MAVDSTLFAADLPAGAYSVGDVVNLGVISGPASVRSGRGAAILKQILCGVFAAPGAAMPGWRIHVKNSDWVDEVQSFPSSMGQLTSLDEYSGLIQFGCDNSLTENSGWMVYAECVTGATSTTANSVYVVIDIDYPSVSAVTNPDALVGYPSSIEYDIPSLPVNAFGSMTSASWVVRNVDYFKAGYQYCLQAVELYSNPSATLVGFISFGNAAGMGGLARIIPISNNPAAIRARIRYASKLVKGPMDIKVMMFNSTATTQNVFFCHDYVKRKGA